MRDKHIIKETGNKEKGLYSIKKYSSGDIVLNLEGNYFPFPTRTSIQVGEDKHIESWKGGHVNHHCLPNTKVISVRVFELKHYLVAIKDIKIGEEITFDYEITESLMSNPFKCRCHGKWIRGKDYEANLMIDEGGMDYSGAFESDIDD